MNDIAENHDQEHVLRIAAIVLNDSAGRTLLVRKRGTSGFMQCGGKLEPGETPLQAVVREVGEELGLTLDPSDLEHLGRFDAPALNEDHTRVDADAYFVRTPFVEAEALCAHREIAEVVWADPERPGVEVAPLSRDVLLPIAAERAGQRTRARTNTY